MEQPKGINRIEEMINGPKIVVIGGGTGLSVILRGMKKITDHLTAVVTVADDGGGSGILREDLGMLPPGDIRSCILAMADEESTMQELLEYRFQEGRLEGQNFGNLFIAALNGIYGNFEEAVAKTNEILRVKGQVVPVTGSDITLCAQLENDKIVCGESKIPEMTLAENSPIKRVFLSPEKPSATSIALEAIADAELIMIGPGSLFTSIIPNLLVDGIVDSICKSSGIKVLICNMMTQPGETDGYTVGDHVVRTEEYLGRGILDYVIANNGTIDNHQVRPYQEDGAIQIIPSDEDRNRLKEQGISLIESNFVDIKKGYIRHDADRIASIIYSLLCD